MAATPGRSNHGWGAAFDIDRPASGWTNGQEGESPEFMWLNKNGPTYNFVFGVRDEHWHMDWMPFSSQTTGGIAPTAQSSWVSPTTADYANV
jgi:LAS superfamily LD-carboxypeptidase LdcB